MVFSFPAGNYALHLLSFWLNLPAALPFTVDRFVSFHFGFLQEKKGVKANALDLFHVGTFDAEILQKAFDLLSRITASRHVSPEVI